MAIDGGMRNQLAAGMRLVAKYRKQQYTAEVVEGTDGKLRFRLADGQEFTSPSAAGSAVMGGIACNGWRFWSLATDDAEPPEKTAAKPSRSRAKPEAKHAAKPARQAKVKSTATTDADPIAATEPVEGEPAWAE